MGKTGLTVLAIDDDDGDAKILQRHLQQLHNYEVQFLHAVDLSNAQVELARPGIDVIFLDYRLGAETGHDLLQAIRSAGDMRPVVVLTGQGDENIAASLMRSGADDYLIKSEIGTELLWRTIESARAKYVRRKMEATHRQLLEDLQIAKNTLEIKNRRLAEMYSMAHQFVDHVSHEFRTPLTVIKEFASIMRDGLAGDVNDEQRDYLGVISARVDDLSVLVDDMLDISKLEAGMLGISRADCTIDDIIGRVRCTLERRAAAMKSNLTINIAPDLPKLYCDSEKIGRVIINLAINALKFCGAEGNIAIVARENSSDNSVTIAVRDDGPGISPQNLKALFQRFQQLNGTEGAPKGFGLGLSIAKELVDLNLGAITVDSQPGVGSTFSFTVPFADRKTLLQRYLKWIEKVRDGALFVSLIRITSEPDAETDLLEDLEGLVLHHTRKTDLLFRPAPHRWLLVAAANQADLCPLIARLQKAHVDANHNRIGRLLPELTLEHDGSWSVMEEPDTFLEAVLQAEGQLEHAYA